MNFSKNNIEYEYVNYGNLYYYNNGFLVQAISITFDYNLTNYINELNKKRKTFLNYMKRKRKRCIGYTVRCGLCIQWYSVFDVSDFKRHQEHENRIKSDTENFWMEEHAKRIADEMKQAV